MRETQSPQPFVLGFYTQALLRAYLDRTGRLDVLAHTLGVPVTWLCHPPEKISVEEYLDLMSAAQSVLSDHCFGLHVGQHMQAASFDILGQAMLKAENLGQATRQVLALESLVHSLGHSEVLQEKGHLRFVWHSHYQMHPLGAQLTASVLAGIIHFAQHLAARVIPVKEVTFMQVAPEEQAVVEHHRVCHGRCRFGQAHNSILVAEDVLGWPVNTDTAAVSVESEFWSMQLAEYLEHSMATGNPSLAAAAGSFNTSERTLQRRLSQEGSTFQGILNAVRNRVALDYLRYSSLSLLEVSQMLGFKEQSSFNHFFLAQQGTRPGAFR